MEVMKILGGLAVIAVLVVVIAMGKDGGQETAAASKPIDRSFASGSTSARFVPVAKD